MDPRPKEVPENLKERIAHSYDAIAEVYNKWTEQHTPARHVYLDKFIEQLPKHEPSADDAGRSPGERGEAGPRLHILELGCGAGVPGTQKLAAIPGAKITANDISARQVELGRANARAWDMPASSSVEFVQGDMFALDFPPASLDGVVALFSIIHLPRDEQTEMLARVGRWLKPGGMFLGNFSEEGMEGVVMEEWLAEEGWMFWSGWGGEGTLERIKGAGMEVLLDVIEEERVDVRFLWVLARK